MSVDIERAVRPKAETNFSGVGHLHRHSVQFYSDDTFLSEDVGRFIGAALGSGDAAVLIATPEHRDTIECWLHAAGLNLSQAQNEGRYVSLDAAHTLSRFMLDGLPHPARFAETIAPVINGARKAAKTKGARVAAFGEMVALLWAEGKPDAAITLEQLWNELAKETAFDLHCAYPIHHFDQASHGRMMEDICASHSHVMPSENYTSLSSEDDRLRAIAILQHKAEALQTEIEEHKKVREHLEHREKQLAERNRELQAAIEARDEFLSVAAHELKTPITSLRGFTQLLLRDARRAQVTSPARLEAALGAVELQTGKLANLVSRLLDTTQIKAGKLRIEPIKADLVALVRLVLDQQQATSGHVLIYHGPEHLEGCVDPMRFEQVLTNLLDNAVKFSPKGSEVIVTLEAATPGGFVLTVTDQGEGIPQAKRDEVFNRLNQVHSHGHLSGMGLGLFIAREIVELHQGTIAVEQPEQGGTRFILTFPSAALPPSVAGSTLS